MATALTMAQWNHLFDIELYNVELDPLKKIVAKICGANMSFAVQLFNELCQSKQSFCTTRSTAGSWIPEGVARAQNFTIAGIAGTSSQPHVSAALLPIQPATSAQVSNKRCLTGHDTDQRKPDQASNTNKRIKVERCHSSARCLQCGKTIDTSHGTDQLCRYHDGFLEQDDSNGFWDDCYVPEEHPSDENIEARIDYAEGFRWSCCQRNGEDRETCIVGEHNDNATERPRADSPTHFAEIEMWKENHGIVDESDEDEVSNDLEGPWTDLKDDCEEVEESEAEDD